MIDVCIMNPPYGGICKRIYEQIYKSKLCDRLISVNPAEYWEFLPYLININPVFFENLQNITIIPHKEFCNLFDIGNGVTGNGCIVEFDYTKKNTDKEIQKLVSIFTDKKIISIVDKFISKMNHSTLVSNKGVKENKTQKAWVANYKKYIEYGNYAKIYTWHEAKKPKDMIICQDDGNGKSIIGFMTKNELDNFIKSLDCWPYYFAKFLTKTDNAKFLSYCPYMSDYTQPWTDERFYKYFDLTDEEIKTIKDTMKE